MRAQLKAAEPTLDAANGEGMYPTEVCGSISRISSSCMRKRIGSPQSRHLESTTTSRPGNSQRTASDSIPHWPYYFWMPFGVMRSPARRDEVLEDRGERSLRQILVDHGALRLRRPLRTQRSLHSSG